MIAVNSVGEVGVQIGCSGQFRDLNSVPVKLIKHLRARQDVPVEAHVVLIDTADQACGGPGVFNKGAHGVGGSRFSAVVKGCDLIHIDAVREIGIRKAELTSLINETGVPIELEGQ